MVIDVRQLKAEDVAQIVSTDGGNGWNSTRALWDRYISEQQIGARTVLIAWDGLRPVGYGSLLWLSEHEPFRSQGIPEINNLGTSHACRKRGLATAVIVALEAVARASGKRTIGIGVGLYADYGDAQRLYGRLGFRPDGRGVTYRNRRAKPGDQIRLDDDLILWLMKPL